MAALNTAANNFTGVGGKEKEAIDRQANQARKTNCRIGCNTKGTPIGPNRRQAGDQVGIMPPPPVATR
jgi:hypothetical protein